jgi:hypothetical protein
MATRVCQRPEVRVDGVPNERPEIRRPKPELAQKSKVGGAEECNGACFCGTVTIGIKLSLPFEWNTDANGGKGVSTVRVEKRLMRGLWRAALTPWQWAVNKARASAAPGGSRTWRVKRPEI